MQNIAGESVVVSAGMLDVKAGNVISLNPTAAWLWDHLGDNEFNEERVAALLVENYDVDPVRALADSRAWINSLRRAGLLEE